MENTQNGQAVEPAVSKEAVSSKRPNEVGVYISHSGRQYTEAPIVGVWAMFQSPKMDYPAFGKLYHGYQVNHKADFVLVKRTNKGVDEVVQFFSKESLKYCFSAAKARVPYPDYGKEK